MCEYEIIFCKALHDKLKEKVKGGLWVRVENDDCLWIDIVQRELDTITHIQIGNPFSELIVKGFSVDEACEEVIKQYRRIILSRCFK